MVKYLKKTSVIPVEILGRIAEKSMVEFLEELLENFRVEFLKESIV